MGVERLGVKYENSPSFEGEFFTFAGESVIMKQKTGGKKTYEPSFS
jgi:hypothetical protein